MMGADGPAGAGEVRLPALLAALLDVLSQLTPPPIDLIGDHCTLGGFSYAETR